MSRTLLIIAALSGFFAVTLGAFGAHALKSVLSEDMRAVWNTGVTYQMTHTLALLLFWGLGQTTALSRQWLTRASWSLVVGIGLFSGSLYLLCLTEQRWLGAITPLGGTAFLAGWLALLKATLMIPGEKDKT